MLKIFICSGIMFSLASTAIVFAAQNNSAHSTMHKNAQDDMHDAKINMPAMHDMADNSMNDMKGGMMRGCMMQSAMNEHMRQSKTFSDKAFLSAMIPHHEAAVAMAADVLKNGRDTQVKKWAEAVIADQEAEIKQMRGWLTALGGDDAAAADSMKKSMHSMMGMPMSKDPDINFVSMMIGHHAGAVEMAVSAIISSTNEDIVKFARNIVHAQLDEIIAYKAWLKAKGR